MRTKAQRLKQMGKLGFLLVMGPVMSAEAGLFGIGGDGWKEEALQPDGTKLVVERKVIRKGRHEIGQRSAIGDQSLSFVMPGTGRQVTWEDRYSDDIRGGNFSPMLVGVLGDKAYVVATPTGCLSYNKWGRPNPPYVVFRYQGDAWQRIPLVELPIELKRPNVVISSPDDAADKAVRGLLPPETIAELNSTARRAEYLAIVREPLTDPAGRCGEMIYDGNGGWIGIGWFKDQPSREACLSFCAWKKVVTQHCPCESIFKRQ